MDNGDGLIDVFMLAHGFVTPLLLALFFFMFFSGRLRKSSFKRFLGVLLIGSISALLPFSFLGLILGSPAIVMSAVLTIMFLDYSPKKDENNEGT